MKLEDFNNAYGYKNDPKEYDQWIIPPIVDGKIRDDCDGYSLGVLYYVVANESIFRFWWLLLTSAKIHRVYNDGHHVVLRVKDRYIDNWTREWVDKAHMESLGHKFYCFQHPLFSVVVKMLYTKIRSML